MQLRTTFALTAALTALAASPGCSCDDDTNPSGPTGGTGGSAGGAGGAGAAGGTGGAAPEGLFIDDLSAPVNVAYDEHGIVHLTCQTDEDCVAALGYVHASNRFFVMDFARHAMRGKLAGLVEAGEVVLESDYFFRLFFTTAEGEPLEDAIVASLSDEERTLLERYAAGVNAWIDDVRNGENGAVLSEEYEFPLLVTDTIADWEPQDSIAVAFSLMDTLGNSTEDELEIGQMLTSLSPELAADLLRAEPLYADYTVTASGATFSNQPAVDPKVRAQALTEVSKRLAPAKGLLRQARERMHRAWSMFDRRNEYARGSNNWLVGPSRTTSGNPILANDPHLGMSNPAVFMLAEIDSMSEGTGTLHVAGGTIPALPAVLTGHNETLAWGVTTANYDQNEVYLETMSPDGSQVWFNGGWVDVIERTFTFANADGEPVDKTFKWVPHHGPIIAEDSAADTAISVRWVLHEGLTDIGSFIALNRGEAVADVPGALADLTVTNQNFISIDTEGNVGWHPIAKIPNRPWATLAMPSWAPVPGDGTAEWSGFIDTAALPQLINPPAGIIATANQDITGDSDDGDLTNDGHAPLQELITAPGVRMHRIVEMLEAGGATHDTDSMLAIQADTYSSIAELVLPPLLTELETLGLTGTPASALAALQQWQLTCPTGIETSDPMSAKVMDSAVAREATGCTVWHATIHQILDGMIGDEEVAADVDFPMRGKLALLLTDLTNPGQLQTLGSFWDDVSTGAVETRADVLTAAMDAVGVYLLTIGPNVDDWRWGRVHHISFASIFNDFGLNTYNNGPFANDGGLYTVDVAPAAWMRNKDERPAPDEVDMAQTWGATVRTVIEPTADGMRMKIQHSGGTNLDRESPFYDQLVENYLQNVPVDFPFGPGAVPNPAIELVIEPTP